jgi:hypothetical protein
MANLNYDGLCSLCTSESVGGFTKMVDDYNYEVYEYCEEHKGDVKKLMESRNS